MPLIHFQGRELLHVLSMKSIFNQKHKFIFTEILTKGVIDVPSDDKLSPVATNFALDRFGKQHRFGGFSNGLEKPFVMKTKIINNL